jgi:Pyridoxamine 5''-phosphate oxidase.
MSTFQQEKEKTMNEISKNNIMVFATSSQNVVTARNMSIITDNNKIFFQTSTLMDKYQQIKENSNIALCVNNIQIQGTARDIGAWNENKELLKLYNQKHKSSFELYGNMRTQTVIEVTINTVKKWDYKDGKPYIYFIDFINETFEFREYDLNN